MLQNIRDNSQGLIAKFIVGFIIITFALFGADALFGISSGKRTVVEVNGEEIDEREIVTAMDLRRRQILAQMGENADVSQIDDKLLRAQVTETLIKRRLLLQVADRYGLAYSDQQINALVVNTPDFQSEGQFDPALFENIVRSQGFLPGQFSDYVREEMLLQHLQSGFLHAAFVTDKELDQIMRLQDQTRDLAYLTIPAKRFAASMEISDEQVEAWYASRADQYMTAAAARIEYLDLDRASLAEGVEVSEDEVRALFDAEAAELQGREERRASHILLSLEQEGRSKDETLTLAQQVLSEIRDGLSFEDAARKYSEDPGTAKQGGDLGYIPREMFSEKFEKPLFELAVNEVSEPVETGFGIHLIKVMDIRREVAPEYETARERYADEVRRNRADQLFAEKLQELSEISYESGDLVEPAEVSGLTIQKTDFLTEQPAEGAEGLAADPRVLQAVFSEDVLRNGLNSDVLELGDGRAVVVRVAEYRAPEKQPLETVRDEVIASIRATEGAAKAQELGQKILTELKAGESTSGVAVEHDLEWIVKGEAPRSIEDVPPSVVRKAFSLPHPQPDQKSLGRVEMANGDFIVVSVSKVTPGAGTARFAESELRQLRQFHASINGGQAFDSFSRALERNSEIDRI